MAINSVDGGDTSKLLWKLSLSLGATLCTTLLWGSNESNDRLVELDLSAPVQRDVNAELGLESEDCEENTEHLLSKWTR